MNSAPDPREILVVGYGNTLRGDDGVGPMLAETVAEQGWPDVRGIALPQLAPELAESLAVARAAIFIDARLGIAPPGVNVTFLVPGEAESATTHACDPQSMLAIADILFGRAPPVWMVTVTGCDFGLGETLSASCREYAREEMKLLEGLIQGLRDEE